MNEKELRRVEVLARGGSNELRVVDASRLLGVSYRQGRRLWKRYREQGPAGLKHRSPGRPSHRARDERFRQSVLRRVREKYGGAVGERFGPTLAAEHLQAEDGMKVHAETLRRWMLEEGLWSRERKRPAAGHFPARNTPRICLAVYQYPWAKVSPEGRTHAGPPGPPPEPQPIS